MKNFIYIAVLALTLSGLKVHATTFQAMPLAKLVDESSGAAEVELKEKRSFMNKMGMILTEYTFNVGESYNIDNGDLDGEFLKITMMGGTVNGVTSFIDGAPDFELGEKSFLLLKKIESQMYISNFTLGKYKILEEEGNVFYVSTVFPNDTEIGKVKKNKMIDMIKLKFKTVRVPEEDSRLVPNRDLKAKGFFKKPAEFEKRAPAQEEDKPRSGPDGLIAMWAFFALLMTTGFTIWWKLRKGVSA